MRPWYEPRKNRPDIPKDMPQKKGFVRYMETLWREFFEMLKLNLLFLVTCIPIVTIPASITAMSRITVTMVQDKNHFLWPDYWKAFKRDFLKSLLGGLILGGHGGGLFHLHLVLLQADAGEYLLRDLGRRSACLLLSALMMSLYFYPIGCGWWTSRLCSSLRIPASLHLSTSSAACRRSCSVSCSRGSVSGCCPTARPL